MKVLLVLTSLLLVANGATMDRSLHKFSKGLFGRFEQDIFQSKVSRVDAGVQRMSIDEVEIDDLSLSLNKMFPKTRLDKDQSTPLSLNDDQFHWDSCGNNSVIELKSLNVKPAPVSFPGTLSFSFNGIVHHTISESAKITANVTIEFFSYGRWTRLPCLGTIGSCVYKDLCSLLSPIQCPTEFTSKGIPCNCPFPKGEYNLPNYSIEIDAEVFLRGKYRARAEVTEPTLGNIGCYEISFTVV